MQKKQNRVLVSVYTYDHAWNISCHTHSAFSCLSFSNFSLSSLATLFFFDGERDSIIWFANDEIRDVSFCEK